MFLVCTSFYIQCCMTTCWLGLVMVSTRDDRVIGFKLSSGKPKSDITRCFQSAERKKNPTPPGFQPGSPGAKLLTRVCYTHLFDTGDITSRNCQAFNKYFSITFYANTGCPQRLSHTVHIWFLYYDSWLCWPTSFEFKSWIWLCGRALWWAWKAPLGETCHSK